MRELKLKKGTIINVSYFLPTWASIHSGEKLRTFIIKYPNIYFSAPGLFFVLTIPEVFLSVPESFFTAQKFFTILERIFGVWKLLFLCGNFISCAETFFGMEETFLPLSIFGMLVCHDHINDAHSAALALYSCMHVYLNYKLSRNYTYEQNMKKQFLADPFAPVHVRSSRFLSNPNSFTQAQFE